jgi:hypothetical protein
MPIVERVFSQIQPAITDQEPLPLSAFWSNPAIIVLGDPGAGKTTSFEQASQAEPNSVLVSVRDFLWLSLGRWRDKTLYLDGLDEQRAKTRDGTGVLDRLRERLDLLGQPFFRLSCRAADWYGKSDADRLRLVSPDRQVTVVRLELLSDENIRIIASEHVSDPGQFLEDARNRHVTDLLRNPQTLNLLLTVVRQGSWPNTRAELFQRACEILSLETNIEHSDYQGPSFSSQEIMTAAGLLCAVHLCGATAGFSLRASTEDQQFAFIGDLPGNRDALALASRRRIFQTAGPSRIEPIHRTVAEYLAGLFLVAKIRESLPLQRVLALITGHDGGTLSDLRGLYAWISCLLTEHAGSLIPRDPLGIILYGDASSLTLSEKKLTLQSLSNLAKENPWFRSESWSSKKPFGGLASADMEPYIRAVLTDSSVHVVFLYCVFDALQNGSPMPQLGDLVIGIARDNGRDRHLRSEAISTFERLCPDRVADLLQLLDDIHAGRVTDPERELRGDLLKILYPSTITPNNIFHYLIQINDNHYGSYNRFIGEHLVPKTPNDQLPVLVQSLGNLQPLSASGHLSFIWERFVGRLTLRLLEFQGESAPIARLYDLLGHTLNRYRKPIADRHESEQIRRWLYRHPDRVRELFKHWLANTTFSRPRVEIHDFWTRLHDVEPPSNFPHFLVDLADLETRPEIASFLFRQAIQLSTYRNRPDRLSLDELFQHVQEHPQFNNALQEELLSEIPDWTIEHAVLTQQRNRQQTQAREERVRWLTQQETLVGTGKPSMPLIFLANLFFGRFYDIDAEKLPEERLITETTQQIATIAKQGFIASLTRPELQSAREIGESHADSKLYEFGYPVLAGMEVLAAISMDRISRLPSRTVQSVIAFHFAHRLDQRQPWLDTLFKDRPEDCAKGLIAFLEPHLVKTTHIPAIYKLRESVALASARFVLPRLLRRFPFCRVEHLEILLSIALQILEKPFLLRLIKRVLQIRRRGITKQHLVLWSAAAFAMSSTIVQHKLPILIGSNLDHANLFLELLFPEKQGDVTFECPLSCNEIVTLILVFGKLFRHADLDGTGWLGLTKRGKGAQKVRYLIEKLKGDASFESTSALVKLLENGKVAAGWREYLQYALSEQARLRRETTFSYPTVQKVVRTLNNQQPANAADLQALALDHLKILKQDFRHGPTDGYKTFWNVDHLGRPTRPKPENICRDRLLDLLKPRLLLKSVNAEPEGHYAEDKRADIKALYAQLNLPIEIKRHWHKDLWTAPIRQLQKLYGRDPGAGGRGIYLVFWFGQAKNRSPRPPRSLGTSPVSADALEEMLSRGLSPQDRVLLEVIVFDCSPRGSIGRSGTKHVR